MICKPKVNDLAKVKKRASPLLGTPAGRGGSRDIVDG